MRSSPPNERSGEVALSKRYQALSAKLSATKSPSENFWNPETSARKKLPFVVRKIAKVIYRFWYRRTFAQLVFGPLIFLVIVILAGPFLWSLLLHGMHLAQESLAESPSDYLKKIETLDSAEYYANVRNLGLISLGIIGTVLAVWRSILAHQAHKLSEKGLVIDRYQKGAQMLESSELSVRLAGIYALRELVWSDPDDTYILVLDLLLDFVRERSKSRKPQVSPVPNSRTIEYGPFPPDLRKALETVSWLRESVPNGDWREQRHNWRPDLTNANLAVADLSGLNLSGAKLMGANLYDIKLMNAKLAKTDLFGANLELSSLINSDLSDADLLTTKLNGAYLDLCKLIGTSFVGAKLQGTCFDSATIKNVDFSRADLTGTDFSHATIIDAHLSHTLMEDANMKAVLAFSGWIFENRPIRKNEEISKRCAVRNRKETKTDFVHRIMSERPDLGWSDEMLS